MTGPIQSNAHSVTGGKNWISEPGILYIAGPTASGKSSAALALAQRFDAEIVSVDSMQVYRGMDIGTAKPTPAELAQVPHHLVNVAELSESYDAARFVREAAQAVEDIRRRGRRVIFCGGTGLYFKAWMEGLGDAPAAHPALRSELESTPLTVLLQEIQKTDPVTFAKIDRNNPRRVIRAVEVIRLTGKPFSQQQSEWGQTLSESGVGKRMFYLVRSPEELRARIEQRVEAMIAAGWVEETEHLRARGLDQARGPRQALGYGLILEHLRGERTLKETVEWIKIRTWQYARRQATWFRRQDGFQRVEADSVVEKAQEALALSL